MPWSSVILFLFSFFNVVILQGTGSGNDGSLRLCIVEGRGTYKPAPTYCPILDNEKSGVECVLGTDRLDCLRRISKGTVDFGVFSPEDLVAAQWANIDVLVTNELRERSRPYERSVVAVVNQRILPDSSSSLQSVLKNSTLCHPGVGMFDIRPMSDTLSGYLESLVLERSCDPNLSLAENRLKALSQFFGKACKAGPWVPDNEQDRELKRQYSSLCAACGSPARCSAQDRYWGDSGALACLADGAGDAAWAELDDVTAYFGITNKKGGVYPSPEQFAYLCRDGTWQPIKNNTTPCVWLNRPWPVVVAKSKASEAVGKLVYSLTNTSSPVNNRWKEALAALLRSHQELPEPLQPPLAPMDYLSGAIGFREAYSQSGCDPPRHVNLCTTSLLEKNKCEWLSEAGAVYGIVPPLQCGAVKETKKECLQGVQAGEYDVAVADSDWLVPAMRDFSLDAILHEATPIVEKSNTVVAYVKADSKITKMSELRGKRAGFPLYDGLAWHSVARYVMSKEKIKYSDYINNYFKGVCAPGVENGTGLQENYKNCYEEGELEALRALVEGKTDVSFFSMATYGNQTQQSWTKDVKITPICPEGNTMYCYLTWANIGHVFASKNITAIRRHEIINVLTKLDQLFGKHPPFRSSMFSMYGPYNHETNVLFHDNAKILAPDSNLRTHPYDKFPFNFESTFLNITYDALNYGIKTTPSLLLILATLVTFVINSIFR